MPDTSDRLDDLEQRVSQHDVDLAQLKQVVGLAIDPNEWVPVRVAATQIGVDRSTLYRSGVVVNGRVHRNVIAQRVAERQAQPPKPTL